MPLLIVSGTSESVVKTDIDSQKIESECEGQQESVKTATASGRKNTVHKRLILPRIIIDSREQLPYDFPGYQTVRKKLDTGDYSLEGYERRVGVERKSKSDAYGCVGASRRRFIECLERLSKLERAAIVIECYPTEFSVPPWRTRITAEMALHGYLSWQVKYGIPVNWWPNREWAERATLRFLMGFYKWRVIGDNSRAAGSQTEP